MGRVVMDAALLTLVVLEAVVIAVLGALVFGLLRSHADILRSLRKGATDLGVIVAEATTPRFMRWLRMEASSNDK